MELAIKAVRGEIEGVDRIGYLKASQLYKVPKSTLERRNKYGNKFAIGTRKFLGNKISVLPVDVERKLATYVRTMEEKLFGLTYIDLRKMAYELAEANSVEHNFNKEDGMAGKHWLYGFLKRFPDLVLRKPENTSVARAISFKSGNVNKFFDLLEKVLADHPTLGPDRIYNCDETGMTTVPNHPPKIVGTRNKKQVGIASSAERGINTTVLVTVSALGNTMPPLFVFPRAKNNPQLLRGAPEGSVQDNAKSGWMQSDIFFRWLERFITFTNASVEAPVLLILDGHTTHVKCIKTIELARENGVIMLSLPPHCTHRMQPLDVSFMKPLSSDFSNCVQQWMRKSPGQTVTIYEVAELFGKAYDVARSPETITNGFKSTGIWPLNRTIFDRYFQSESTSPEDDQLQPVDKSSSESEQSARDNDSSITTLPEDIIPIPNVTYKKSKKSKRASNPAGKTAIVTSSPYLKELTLSEENKALRDEIKELKKALKDTNKALKNSNSGRGESSTNNDSQTDEVNKSKTRKRLFKEKGKLKKKKNQKKKTKSNDVINTLSSDSELEEITDLSTNSAAIDQKVNAEIPIINLEVEVGKYILVEFSGKKDKGALYVGCIVEVLEGQRFMTRFLRRADLKKNRVLKFKEVCDAESEEQAMGEHGESQIRLVLPAPKRTVGTARTSSLLSFDDSRLENFINDIE